MFKSGEQNLEYLAGQIKFDMIKPVANLGWLWRHGSTGSPQVRSGGDYHVGIWSFRALLLNLKARGSKPNRYIV